MLFSALTLVLAQAATPAPVPTPAADGPFVELELTQGRAPLGTVVIALDPARAPISVENFLAYVRSGHYDGTVFHRVIPGFMIQGGGYTPELDEKPTRGPIENEGRNLLRNSRGTVAMARLDDPNSATSQFYINLRDNHRLDFGIGGAGYAVFGRVVQGMEIVDRIATVTTSSRGQHQNVPQVSVIVRSAREVKWTPPTPAGSEPAAPEAGQAAPPQPR